MKNRQKTFNLPEERWPIPFNVGDVVTIHIPKENRDSGYNPCPDGTKARVLGYAGIMYGSGRDEVRIADWQGPDVNLLRARLLLEDGREHSEYAFRLQLLEKREYD